MVNFKCKSTDRCELNSKRDGAPTEREELEGDHKFADMQHMDMMREARNLKRSNPTSRDSSERFFSSRSRFVSSV